MNFYKIASATKFILGITILTLVYSYINIYEDPAMGIGLGFLGLFITLWGFSFYVFLLAQKAFRTNQDKDRLNKDSYKLSLLFGIYAMINVLLLLRGKRSKLLGLILLIAFIFLQISLFSDKKLKHEHRIG